MAFWPWKTGRKVTTLFPKRLRMREFLPRLKSDKKKMDNLINGSRRSLLKIQLSSSKTVLNKRLLVA